MNTKSNPSIRKNFIFNVILKVSELLFPLITFPYISRVLLPAGTGKVNLAISIISYFNMLAQLGLPVYGIRVCAKVRDDRRALSKTVQELMIIQIVTLIISYAAFFVCLLFVPKMYNEKTLYLIVSISILMNAIGMEWLYAALEKYTYISVRSIVFKAIAVIFMFLMVKSEGDYVIYGGISIFASSMSCVVNFMTARKYIDFKPVGHYNFKMHIPPILMFFAMACAVTVYTNLDTVMLGFMKTDADVGYYNAAVRIKSIMVGIVTSLGTVLLARSAYLVEQGEKDKFQNISRNALNFVFLFSIPVLVYCIFFAKQGILLLSGDAFHGAVLPMQVIMPTLIFIGITNILGIQILVPLGKEKTVCISEIVGAVVDLILNMILIPKLAATGAAIGTLVAEFAVLCVQAFALRKDFKNLFSGVSYLKIFGAVLVACCTSFWVGFMDFAPWLSILVSGCIFFGVYGGILLLTREKMTIDTKNRLFGLLKKS